MFAFSLLARHPEVQQKALEEVTQVLGDREPTYADYPNLIYCRGIFKETLRLFPVVGFIPKRTSVACELGGMHIPAKVVI
jgi:cytochrome P450